VATLSAVPASAPLIDDELAAFLHGPVSSILGTADAQAVPDASRIAGLVAVGDDRLRVLISTEATAARANAVVGARVAVSVTHIATYRSLVWKGVVDAAEPVRTAGDLALVDRHIQAFRGLSPQVGIPARLADHIFPTEVVPLVIRVDTLFDQTPGPGAGRLLRSSP
jgi:hypothetical protein